MTPAYDDGRAVLYVGHVLDVLAQLPAKSIQTCITSPPYYGLRSYGTDPQVWGGSSECAHEWGEPQTPGNYNWSEYIQATGNLDHGHQKAANAQRSHTCTRCGAWRGELGSEPTPDCGAWARGVEPCSVCFVCHLVVVFRAVRRVLHPTGCMFVNLGDSYSNTGNERPSFRASTLGGGLPAHHVGQMAKKLPPGLGAKQLMMLPARVALALQADGWVLRSAITWCKKAPMPESVTDRPTSATEMVYLLAKQPRYYYDAEAVRQSAVRPGDGGSFGGAKGRAYTPEPNDPNYRNGHDQAGREFYCGAGANLRNFWLLGPESYPGSHFAVFPRKLVEPCVLAGSRAGDTVLDPFAGSGTTLEVARWHQRRAVGIELSADYARLVARRLVQGVLL